MAMQRHINENGKDPTTWKIIYNTADGEIKDYKCRLGIRLLHVWILVVWPWASNLTSLSLRSTYMSRTYLTGLCDYLKWHIVCGSVKGRKEGKEGGIVEGKIEGMGDFFKAWVRS